MVKNLPALQETWVQSLGREDFLAKGKATHSSTLAWRIPWTRQTQTIQESDMTERLHFTSLHFSSSSVQLCLTLCDPTDCSPPGSYAHEFSRQEHWHGVPFPTPGIFLTQGSNSSLLQWQADSFPLEPPGKPYCILQ